MTVLAKDRIQVPEVQQIVTHGFGIKVVAEVIPTIWFSFRVTKSGKKSWARRANVITPSRSTVPRAV